MYTHDNISKVLSIFLLFSLVAIIAIDIPNNITQNAIITPALNSVLCATVRDSIIIIRPEVIG